MPRILLQQGTNLVNKFALLLHKCRFAQDSRDKPETDGSWRCWLSICYKLFNYPSPADKSATSPARGEVLNKDVVRQYATLLERRVQSSTRVRKMQVVNKQTNPIGRSMIEMLGVLAIIAVLSVGGIAGYSKAMEKFKVNKILDEYSFMIAGLVEHTDDLGRNSYRKESGYFGEGLVDWIEGLNLVPATWHRINDIAMSDSSGNVVQWYKASNNSLAVDFYLGGWQENENQNNSSWLDGKSSTSFSPKLCVEIFENLVQPLHYVLYNANTFNSMQSGKGITFSGDSICGSTTNKCLSAASLADFHQACQVCDATGVCAITLWFRL